MNDKESQSFKIRLDEDEGDPPIKESVGDLQVRKLNQRVTLFTVLIPCLLGILMVFAYMDLKTRMTNIHTTGSTEFQNLSQDVQTRLTTLSSETADLKALVQGETDALKKKDLLLAIDLDKNKTGIKKLQSGKADKKSLTNAISGVEKKISPVTRGLKAVDSEMTRLDKKISDDVAKLNQEIQGIRQELDTVESNLAFLSENQIDQRQIDLSLGIQEKKLRQSFSEDRKKIENKIASLKSKTDALEKKLALIAASQSAQTPPRKETPEDSPNIVEQDLTE
jgi:chromosome segregation ATPase